MQVHSPAGGHAPRLCDVQHQAPHIPGRLGPAGAPCAIQEDADHCQKKDETIIYYYTKVNMAHLKLLNPF